MDEPISVKPEVDYGQQILLFYVDENGTNEQSIITTVDDIQQQGIQMDEAESYYYEEGTVETDPNIETLVMDTENAALQNHTTDSLDWNDSETRRLLVFYIDNKNSFINGTTQENVLWSVACKTMLQGSYPRWCKNHLEQLRRTYYKVLQDSKDGSVVVWPHFSLASKAFENSKSKTVSQKYNQVTSSSNDKVIIKKEVEKDTKDLDPMTNNILLPNADASMLALLYIYLELKKNKKMDPKDMWETIAVKMNVKNIDFWKKRFSNYKLHYIKLLERYGDDQSSITWPYFGLFNKIFQDDSEFQSKYHPNRKAKLVPVKTTHMTLQSVNKSQEILDWNRAQMVILAKHYFDRYDEHQDPTIPKLFLWTEAARLLYKKPEECHEKYEKLRLEHLDLYFKGGYDINNRTALCILYDHIISKDVQNLLTKRSTVSTKDLNNDLLIQFLHDNVEVFKDKMCYYVCWAAIAQKLKASIYECLSNWNKLKERYKFLLNEKRNHPENTINWSYFQLFDRIFDYGMDTQLLLGYENESKNNTITSNVELDNNLDVKIVQYIMKNKHDFKSFSNITEYKCQEMAHQIGFSAKDCANRLNSINKAYKYIRTEIDGSNEVDTWPYYDVSKQAFRYIKTTKEEIENCNANDLQPLQAEVIRKHTYGRKWTAASKAHLLKLYLKHIKYYNGGLIDSQRMWKIIAHRINKDPIQSQRMFVKLKRLNQTTEVNTPYKKIIDEILKIKPKFKTIPPNVLKKKSSYHNVEIPLEKCKEVLTYYLNNLEYFVSEKYNKRHAWRVFSQHVNLPIYKLYQKIHYLKSNYSQLINSNYGSLIKQILAKERKILKSEVKLVGKRGRSKLVWPEESVKKLLNFYLKNIDKFSDAQYSNKYLWYQLSLELNEAHKECSRRFKEIKSQYYYKLLKDNPQELEKWPYTDIFQQICLYYNQHRSNDC